MHITAFAPASCASRASTTAAWVDSAVTLTTTGPRPATREQAFLASSSRSLVERRSTSDTMPSTTPSAPFAKSQSSSLPSSPKSIA